MHHLFGVGCGEELVPIPPFQNIGGTDDGTCAFALCGSGQPTGCPYSVLISFSSFLISLVGFLNPIPPFVKGVNIC